MAVPDQEYRSLMLRKTQLLAQEHGGISNIPREIQTKLGFDVIAGRKGSFSISVRIPDGDLSARIAELKSELPKITFESAKPDPEKIFGKYTPQVSEENPTMDDFWIMQGWYKEDRGGIRLTRANWKDDEKVRAEAVRFLVEKVLKKDPRSISQKDFESNRLGGLLVGYYEASPYAALTEAGYAFPIEDALQHAASGSFRTDKAYPWEMEMAPRHTYEERENRASAVRWLVWKLQKDPRDITQEDFTINGLEGLLMEYYNGSQHAALIDAGHQIHPWEMMRTPAGFFASKENRVAATKWLVAKLKKSPRDIKKKDFDSNCLRGLLPYCNESPYEALFEAGLITPEDERYMRSRTNDLRDEKGRFIDN